MIRVALAAIVAVTAASTAQAHTKGLSGSYRVEQVVTEKETLVFPDVMAQEGKDLVWGRWRWTFDGNRLTLASEAFYLDGAEQSTKGRTTIEESQYAHCGTEVTVEVGWVGHELLLPTQLQAESRFGRFDRRGEGLALHHCNVRLNGVSSLTPVQNQPGAPPNAITLANPTRTISFVLVPDEEKPNFRGMIAE